MTPVLYIHPSRWYLTWQDQVHSVSFLCFTLIRYGN